MNVAHSTPANANGSSWSTPAALGRSSVQVTYAISCPSATTCVVVNGHGQALIRDNGHWSAPHAVDAGGSFDALSCANATFCVAIAGANAVTYNGHAWTRPVTMGPRGYSYHLSCPSTTFCAAVGASGVAGQKNVLATFDGHTWRHVTPPGSRALNDRLLGVSCASSRFCVATNMNGHLVTFDGRRWATSRVVGPTGLISAACPSSTFCMAVSMNGEVMIMRGTTWSHGRAIPRFAKDFAYSVSCATAHECHVIGLSGRAVSWRDGQWSQPAVVFPGTASAGVQVSCTRSGYCVAVNDDARSSSI